MPIKFPFIRTILYPLFLMTIFLNFVDFTFATPGDLDLSFGNQGRQVILIPNVPNPGGLVWNPTEDIVFQPDGKILIAGSAYNSPGGFSFTVTRFNTNGSLDLGFGNGGVFRYEFGNSDDEGKGIALQPDGKIVVVGQAYLGVVNNEADTAFGVLRLNPNGTLDSTFGNGGVVITNFFSSLDYATEVAIQPDGKIIATGMVTQGGVNSGSTYDFALVRYNPNGSLDQTFGNGGIVFTDFNGLGDIAQSSVLQPDGKIVLTGWVFTTIAGQYDFGLARYNIDGSLDTTFDGDGKVVTTFGNNLSELARAITIAPDGKLVVTGDFYNPPPIIGQSGHSDVATARYNTDGSLDSSFDGDGRFVYNSNISDSNEGSDDVVVQPDGKILIVGGSYLVRNAVPGVSDKDLLLLRLNVNGSLDSSFASGGIKLTDFGLFNQPGSPEFGSGRTGDRILTATIGLQPDGKIVAACDSTFRRAHHRLAVARFQNDITTNTVRRVTSDFDGDGKTDVSVFRPGGGAWYVSNSSSGAFSSFNFGQQGDLISPADYDGDGKTDVAVYRSGIWYLSRSRAGFIGIQFGESGDIPVPADYTGDGRAEIAVYRSGVWYVLNLVNNQFQAIQFGISTDKPVPADFDGDSKTDVAVYRDGVWYYLRSSDNSFQAVQFGIASDKPVVGDYDGDAKADFAVYRSGVWYVLGSAQGFYAVQFGIPSDVPVAGDYDGDGKTDIAVYRDGIWYLLRSQQGFGAVQFGITNDKPIPAAYVS